MLLFSRNLEYQIFSQFPILMFFFSFFFTEKLILYKFVIFEKFPHTFFFTNLRLDMDLFQNESIKDFLKFFLSQNVFSPTVSYKLNLNPPNICFISFLLDKHNIIHKQAYNSLLFIINC